MMNLHFSLPFLQRSFDFVEKLITEGFFLFTMLKSQFFDVFQRKYLLFQIVSRGFLYCYLIFHLLDDPHVHFYQVILLRDVLQQKIFCFGGLYYLLFHLFGLS